MAHSREVLDFGAHVHLTDPDEYESHRSYIEAQEGAQIHSDFAALVRRYEQSVVDGAVLSAPFFLGHGNVERVAAENDALRSSVETRNGYYGLAAIPTAAGGEAAAHEFRRCLDAGLHGGALETKSAGIELSDAELAPVLEVASQYGAPVLVHPKLTESLHPDALAGNLRLNAIFGREAALGASILTLVQEEVFASYDDLNLVFHHLGGNIASFLGRIHLQYEPQRWPEADHVVPFDRVKSILEEHVYLDTSGYYGYHGPLQTTLAEFPSSQVLFGSDFPYETRRPETFEKLVSSIDAVASNRDAAAILGENARALLVNT